MGSQNFELQSAKQSEVLSGVANISQNRHFDALIALKFLRARRFDSACLHCKDSEQLRLQ